MILDFLNSFELCTHAHIHTCTHVHIRTYTHVHLYVYIHTFTLARMYTYTHAHIHTCTHAHMHTCRCPSMRDGLVSTAPCCSLVTAPAGACSATSSSVSESGRATVVRVARCAHVLFVIVAPLPNESRVAVQSVALRGFFLVFLCAGCLLSLFQIQDFSTVQR